jgi:hypothetical protein
MATQMKFWMFVSEWLDRENKRCHHPSRICRELGDMLLEEMLRAGE